MTYDQYSQYALTGYDDSLKNRIDNNQLASNAEVSRFPELFDIFVNKENASLGGFSVTEEHTLGQFNGSTLYLDHRLALDISGNHGGVTPSDGVINTGAIDIYDKTVEFSTMPTASPFTITYVAAGDQVQDSHINALQNVVMNIQNVLGLKSNLSGAGTGIVTLPIVSHSNPGSLAEATAFSNILPNGIMLQALNTDLRIGGSQNNGVPGYGETGTTIYIGNDSAITRNNVVIDADEFTLQTTNSSIGGTYVIGTTTGDSVTMSGMLTVASQTTIGLVGGAGASVQTGVPAGAQAFYDDAMLRVHGGVWFGSGLSGNGSITFITTTGESVSVTGPFNATSLTVDQQATFNGNAVFNRAVDVRRPGYITTDADITLTDKATDTPSKIDGLDPSYAAAALGQLGGERITESVRKAITTADSLPNNQLMKVHPLLGLKMYPIVGGWTFTGQVLVESVDLGLNSHRNILLLQTNLTGIGTNYSGASTSTNLGGGTNPYGVYATGLFNPGDTYIEISDVSAADDYIYPIYHHVPFMNGGILTGLNVYLAGDDASLQASMVAGKTFRLFQPGNAPLQNIKPDNGTSFSSATAPVAQYGNTNHTDYPYAKVGGFTNKSYLGGNNVINGDSLYKSVDAGSYVSVSLLDAFRKNIEYSASTSYAHGVTGVAYLYIAGNNKHKTLEDTIELRASPYPYAPIGAQLQFGSPKSIPGQDLPVGEVVASTTDGTIWSHIESISYRTNGVYDSCWLPMVQYRSSLSTLTTIPTDLGRCLPIYGTEEDTEYVDSDGNERYQFYIEHNIGPVRSLSDVDLKIWVAAYGSTTGAPILTGAGNDSLYRAAASHRNLWTPYAQPYETTHDFYRAPSNTPGFLKDMSNYAQIKMLDSRFAMISMSNTEAQFEGYSDVYAQYMRIVLRKRT